MDMTRACILIATAMGKAALEANDAGHRSTPRPFGVFVVDAPSGKGLDALRAVVETLDHRIRVMDSDRTNLNDLEVWNSPMRELARFAAESDRTYVVVLRGWVPEMGKDPRIANFRTWYGDPGIPIVLSDTAEGLPDSFVLCDLSQL